MTAKVAKDYIEKQPRRSFCCLKDPLTMDELILDRLGLEYTRYESDGLGKISYAVVQLSDGQVITITKRDHQNGRMEYHDVKGTLGGIIELEYDYGTFSEQDPNLFPSYDEFLKYVLSELKIRNDEVLNTTTPYYRTQYVSFMQAYRDFYNRIE